MFIEVARITPFSLTSGLAIVFNLYVSGFGGPTYTTDQIPWADSTFTVA